MKLGSCELCFSGDHDSFPQIDPAEVSPSPIATASPPSSFFSLHVPLLSCWRFPVLTVHLLGHAHVTQNGQPVPLSAKAVALIAYLAAEKLPQHRERLADLLWNTAEARTNLRVELARIRSAGLNIFPASRQLLYLESISTDIDQWQAQQEREMNQTELSTWLATLRGLPLCGLEDLGSTGFQVWVEEQRWMLCEKVESVLARVYAHYVRSGQDWATRLISSRAEAVGFSDPAEFLTEALINEARPLVQAVHSGPDTGARLTYTLGQGRSVGQAVPGSGRAGATGQVAGTGTATGGSRREPSGSSAIIGTKTPGQAPTVSPGSPSSVLHFARPQEETRLQALLAPENPLQFMYLHGPAGSGKTYLAERLAAHLPPAWEVLRLTVSRSGRLLLAALAQSLIKLAEPDQAQVLRQVLLQPGALEEDMVKVAVSLAQIRQPLLLLLDEVHAAPAELAGLLELFCQMSSDHPRRFLLLGRENPDLQPVTRTLVRRLPAAELLGLSPVALSSVQQVLVARYPLESSSRLQSLASRLVQRSEGNSLHLLTLLGDLPEAETLREADLSEIDLGKTFLPQVVRDTLRNEPEGWPDVLRDALSRLSVINGAFDLATAQAVLNLDRDAEVDTLLCAALDRQILLEIDPGMGLSLPDLRPVRLRSETETQYMFRNEALRVTLTAQLPQLIRQDVRRRLSVVLTEKEPGLASYYAERAGLQEQAEVLVQRHRARLPFDSPLKDHPARILPSSESDGTRALINEPARLSEGERRSAAHQGYSISLESGWLTVMSDGRYGHPQTLTLRMALAEPLRRKLRLVWRLDVFAGGEELRPSQAAFPLRLTPVKSGASAEPTSAFVFAPQRDAQYQEHELLHEVQPHVELGVWMEHHLNGTAWQGATAIEISVRALDVALTIGVIEADETGSTKAIVPDHVESQSKKVKAQVYSK